jgi:hypothetical protein
MELPNYEGINLQVSIYLSASHRICPRLSDFLHRGAKHENAAVIRITTNQF